MRKSGMVAVSRLIVALIVIGVPSLSAGVYTLWDWQTPKLPRESEASRTQHITIWCYDVRNPGHLLNCSYSLLFDFDPPNWNDVAWNGGHLHFVGRATAPKAIGTMTTCEPSTTHTTTSCAGFTLERVGVLDHTVPEVSGVITARASLTFPPGWLCADFSMCDDATHRTFLAEIYTNVGFPGFVELPSDPVHYVRCGETGTCGGVDNTDPNHPYGFFGTPQMIQAVQRFAAHFQEEYPGQRLRLTDMSLPAGGLFDYQPRTFWQPPHKGHRRGTSVDVCANSIGDDGTRPVIDKKKLNTIACDSGLNRFMGEAQIHYNLGPCSETQQ